MQQKIVSSGSSQVLTYGSYIQPVRKSAVGFLHEDSSCDASEAFAASSNRRRISVLEDERRVLIDASGAGCTFSLDLKPTVTKFEETFSKWVRFTNIALATGGKQRALLESYHHREECEKGKTNEFKLSKYPHWIVLILYDVILDDAPTIWNTSNCWIRRSVHHFRIVVLVDNFTTDDKTMHFTTWGHGVSGAITSFPSDTTISCMNPNGNDKGGPC